jgi:hypothetical protein
MNKRCLRQLRDRRTPASRYLNRNHPAGKQTSTGDSLVIATLTDRRRRKGPSLPRIAEYLPIRMSIGDSTPTHRSSC